ncbi:metallophosphoesterase family protein [Spirochaeta cellobiosiphila]|uniref:metallophosphoesterase family protein n=1 Tax=Spirochaeta cellobiosiphila TaxID=504483 RepID=UPI000414A4F5|nr:metallophosphoesterase family protein [Spirochaeta cellobiosiphila]
MSNKIYERHLASLYESCEELPLDNDDKYLILSDLHMGNRSKKDDFILNRDLVYQILRDYYLPNNYKIILNGDIEELQKFTLETVHQSNKDFFDLFQEFGHENIIKIWGNHDAELTLQKEENLTFPIREAIKLNYKGRKLFILHGHQATMLYSKFNAVVGFLLKFIFHPLGIKNLYFAADSRKQFTTEKRIYQFSRQNSIVSIIGHTHRPLFESLSKREDLKLRMEAILRKYGKVEESKKKDLRIRLEALKKEWYNLSKQQKKEQPFNNGLYQKDLLQPNLFNSGCGIGKNGITALEISKGKIKLVHWIDVRRGNKKFYDPKKKRKSLKKNSPFQKIIIKQDDLDYIFNRIELLH